MRKYYFVFRVGDVAFKRFSDSLSGITAQIKEFESVLVRFELSYSYKIYKCSGTKYPVILDTFSTDDKE